MPIRGEELLDAEFADDTSLYLHGQEANLRWAECAIESFCATSRAKIYWQKIVGFWVSDTPILAWTPNLGFKWIQIGRAHV